MPNPAHRSSSSKSPGWHLVRTSDVVCPTWTVRGYRGRHRRHAAGENALNVIQRVKAKLEDLKPTLPEGVEVVTTYDRSELIERSIHTLKHSLIEEMIIVSIVI